MLDPETRSLTTFDPGAASAFLWDFRRRLLEEGRSSLVVRQWTHAAAHLGWWLHRHDTELNALDQGTLKRFAAHLSSCDCPSSRPGKHGHTRRGVRAFLSFLVSAEVVSSAFRTIERPTPQPKTDIPILAEFNAWMLRRGTKEVTLVGYGYAIRELLTELGEDPLTAATIRRVLLRRSERVSITHAKSAATAIRMFLRFMVLQGACSADLVAAVPKIAHWRLQNLPRFISTDALSKLLDQPDTSSPRGLRARAVLLLLARLGLRAGDVAGLLLSEIDWDRGRLRVCGKGHRQAWLPLCQEIGDALLAYLKRGRPKSKEPHFFLTARKPHRPMSSGAVSGLVRSYMSAAGLPPRGAHVLRHTAATELLRQGLPLEAIGVVLRHQSVETTALYAKVDLEVLKTVVQPWPGATAC